MSKIFSTVETIKKHNALLPARRIGNCGRLVLDRHYIPNRCLYQLRQMKAWRLTTKCRNRHAFYFWGLGRLYCYLQNTFQLVKRDKPRLPKYFFSICKQQNGGSCEYEKFTGDKGCFFNGRDHTFHLGMFFQQFYCFCIGDVANAAVLHIPACFSTSCFIVLTYFHQLILRFESLERKNVLQKKLGIYATICQNPPSVMVKFS